MTLSKKHCTPCQGGVVPFTESEARALLPKVPGWQIVEEGRAISREWKFANYIAAQQFVVSVGEIAEAEQHHPDISFGWGYVKIRIQTHKINGLHENDFILAGKIGELEMRDEV